MKQYVGDEIVRIMRDMPAELVDALRDAHPDHRISEFEAHWSGFLQFAQTDAFEGEVFVIKINATGDEAVQSLLPYVQSCRDADQRGGLVRRSRPELGLDMVG